LYYYNKLSKSDLYNRSNSIRRVITGHTAKETAIFVSDKTHETHVIPTGDAPQWQLSSLLPPFQSIAMTKLMVEK
jgi:hypothetical protein